MAGVAFTILLCTDGSELARAALAAGLEAARAPDRVVIATAVDAADPMLVVGTGMAGGVMSADEVQQLYDEHVTSATAMLESIRTGLGLADTAETMVVAGPPGPTLCDLAESLPASVMVIGTRGHGGLRRAVIGSVSDHIVRHAPCPVITVGVHR
jgi:nucleotide-binding universal stress UspA family protein